MLSWLFEFWIWKILVLESHQNNVPNNCDKFFKYIVKLPSLLALGCTLFSFDLSFFFLFCILIWFFFSCFSNTSICINPEFHNFSSTDFNLISKISQHRIENKVILILELKTVRRSFKNTIELMYRICMDLTHKYELKSKRKKHQRIKQIQIKNWIQSKSRNQNYQKQHYIELMTVPPW